MGRGEIRSRERKREKERETHTHKNLRWFYPKSRGRNSLKIRPM